jgi:DNA-binding LacI/PurR family transcriptional regulator
LTPVRQPLFESGRSGGELLLQMLAGADQQLGEEYIEQLPLELVIRATTGPPQG